MCRYSDNILNRDNKKQSFTLFRLNKKFCLVDFYDSNSNCQENDQKNRGKCC